MINNAGKTKIYTEIFNYKNGKFFVLVYIFYFKNNWLSFFDVDEFLELNEKYKTIKEFLKDDIFEKCKNIKINWLVYKNYNSLYYENKPLQERIKTFSYNYIENIHIKSTVKGNLYLNYWETISNPHTSNLKIYTWLRKKNSI